MSDHPVIPTIPGSAHRINASDRPTIVLVTSDACVPCAFLKPVIRKLAIEADGGFDLVEVRDDDAADWVAAQAIDRFPQLLTFRGGAVADRAVGYHGEAAARAFVEASSGRPLPTTAGPAEQAFADGLAAAVAAFDAAMEAPRRALDPYFQAVEPALRDLERRVDVAVRAGATTEAEAGRLRCSEQACLFEPFAHEVAALAQVQSSALAAFEAAASRCVEAYAAATGSTDVAAQRAAARIDARSRIST